MSHSGPSIFPRVDETCRGGLFNLSEPSSVVVAVLE